MIYVYRVDKFYNGWCEYCNGFQGNRLEYSKELLPESTTCPDGCAYCGYDYSITEVNTLIETKDEEQADGAV